MNTSNMLIQFVLLRTTVVRSFTFEWLRLSSFRICVCFHKFHIWMAYCLHELMQHNFSSYLFEKIYGNPDLLVTNFKFERLLSIMNCFNMLFHFEINYSHKLQIWMAYFLHELMQHPFENKFHIWIFTYFHNNKKFGSGRKIWEIWYRDESLRCVCALRIVAIIHGIFCQDWPWRQEMQLTSVASINSKRQHLKSCHSIYIRTVSS